MKFFIKDSLSKCDQIRRKLWIGSHFLNKSLMKNFIFCAVKILVITLKQILILLTQNLAGLQNRTKLYLWSDQQTQILSHKRKSIGRYMGSNQAVFKYSISNIQIFKFFLSFLYCPVTVRKVPVLGVFVVHLFPHLG